MPFRYLPSRGFKFKEAFKLMKYQSERTGHVAWVWNSRDGITPFGIQVKQEDGTVDMYQHTDWHEDAFLPNFVPPVGMRVFVDQPDFDQAKHQFNVRTEVVDQKLHDHFQEMARDHTWKPNPIPHRIRARNPGVIQ